MKFEELQIITKFIMEQYCNCKLNGFNWENEELIELIDNGLRRLEENDFELMVKEFLNNDNKYWWKEKYSKSTYYRHKRMAMNSFIDCLFTRNVV